MESVKKIKIKSISTGRIPKDDKDLILKVERLIETINSLETNLNFT